MYIYIYILTNVIEFYDILGLIKSIFQFQIIFKN